MKVLFTKAHGAKNDFLLTWRKDAPETGHAELARAICDRHTGIGADGWLLVDPATDAEAAAIQLYNSDGSAAEISGNGTRCAAAFLIRHGHSAEIVRIRTGAGVKTLSRVGLPACDSSALKFEFEMNMGRPEVTAARFDLLVTGGARCDAGLGGQSAVRRARREFRFRLACIGRRDRISCAFPKAHQRLVH